MDKLNGRIKNHDKDIERMCNCHYQGFVECIHELLQVRPQAQSLIHEIVSVDEELQKSCTNIIRKGEELVKYRRIGCNTQTAIEHLQKCLPMLETFSKLLAQMSEKKYYSALKTLEMFETVYMPKIVKYRFAQPMRTKVPQIRETIKKESIRDLKDFLENIRQLTGKIGQIAMRNMAHQHRTQDFAAVLINGHDQLAKSTPSADTETDDFFSAEESATDIVDFSPVYRCLHIFGCLGSREEFENYYRYQRQQQAILILNSLSSSANSNIFIGDTFRNYLFGIVGFFVIEDHLLNTSNGLVTKAYLVANWDFVIKTLVSNLQSQAALCTDCQQMLYMKSLLMLFCYTTQSYGYSVAPLRQLLVELRQLYTEVLMRQWALEFKRIFEADNYHPLVVHDQTEFDDHLEGFPFAELAAFDKATAAAKAAAGGGGSEDGGGVEEVTTTIGTFPKRFPFSSMVPTVYKAVKRFIVVSLEFTQDLNLSADDIEDTARKSTNLLLTRTLSDSLSTLIKKPNLGLLQLIQISINTIYLEEASSYLEAFITSQIRAHSEAVAAAAAAGRVLEESTNTAKANNDDDGGEGGPPDVPKHANAATNTTTTSHNTSGTSDQQSQSHLARLQGKTMFKDARSEAESQIYIQLNKKIDEFFDLATYDYTLADSPGKASSYILDLMAFLKSTFEAFTNLPLKIAQTACLSACKYISMRLLNVLEDDVKAMSHGFLQQFNLDLMQCEMFAGSEPVKDFEEGALQSCFAELRQIMDLFVEFDSWSTYFAEHGKNESRYLRVQPQMALTLLEKLVRGDSKKTIFSSLSKNERDKKSKIDTILKKLRQLVAETNKTNY